MTEVVMSSFSATFKNNLVKNQEMVDMRKLQTSITSFTVIFTLSIEKKA